MAPSGGEPRILTVTDSFADQRAITDALAPHFKVLPVTSAAAGLTLLHREEVDVVLAELVLPGQSGADFLREAGAQREVGRVLLADYSAYAERARLNKDSYFLAIKPIHPAGLLRAVNQALTFVKMRRTSVAASQKARL